MSRRAHGRRVDPRWPTRRLPSCESEAGLPAARSLRTRRPGRQRRTAALLGAGTHLRQHLRRHPPSENPAYTSSLGKPSAASRPRSPIVAKPTSCAYPTPSSQVGERFTVVEIRGMNDVPGSAQLVGETEEPAVCPCAWWKRSTSAMALLAKAGVIGGKSHRPHPQPANRARSVRSNVPLSSRYCGSAIHFGRRLLSRKRATALDRERPGEVGEMVGS